MWACSAKSRHKKGALAIQREVRLENQIAGYSLPRPRRCDWVNDNVAVEVRHKEIAVAGKNQSGGIAQPAGVKKCFRVHLAGSLMTLPLPDSATATNRRQR